MWVPLIREGVCYLQRKPASTKFNPDLTSFGEHNFNELTPAAKASVLQFIDHWIKVMSESGSSILGYSAQREQVNGGDERKEFWDVWCRQPTLKFVQSTNTHRLSLPPASITSVTHGVEWMEVGRIRMTRTAMLWPIS